LSKPDPAFTQDEFHGIPLHNFPRTGGGSGSRAVSSMLVGKRVMQLAVKQGFDIVHSHLPVVASSVAAWKRAIPSKIVFDTHDWFKLHDEVYYSFPSVPGFFAGFVDALEQEIARRHDGVLVTSNLVSGLLRSRGNVFVVPNAVDTSLFKRGESRSRKNRLGGSDFVIGFLGTVSVHQGFWELLQAVRIVSSKVEGVKLLAVGGGLVEEAKEHSRRLGIGEKVVFTGPERVPSSEIPDLINAMDVAVCPLQPSPIYQDYAQPLKLLEYMACGVPIVTTPLAEPSRMVAEAGTGAVARGFGAEKIAEAVLEVRKRLGNPADREASRQFVESNHSIEKVLGRLTLAYDSLLAQKRLRS